MSWDPQFGPNPPFQLSHGGRQAVPNFMPREPQAISTAFLYPQDSISFETQLKYL